MTELATLKYLGLYAEPAGETTFGVSHGSTPGDFIAVPYMEGSLKIDWPTETLDPMLGTTHIDGASKKVLGVKKCTVAFDVPLHSHGADLGGTTAVPTVSNWALLRLLKIVFGGASSTTAPGADTTVQAASTTTVVNVTAGHGVRFTRGGCIACVVTSGSSQVEIREIASVSTDAITVKEAFSAAPVLASTVRGGITVYPANLGSTGDAAQFLYQGRAVAKNFVFAGCNGTVALTVDMKTGLSKLSFSLAGVNWETLAAHSGVTTPSYANVGIIRTADAPLTVPEFGVTTRAPYCAADFKLELGIAYEDLPCGSATNGQAVGGKVRTPGRPLVKGSFSQVYEDNAERDAFEARDDRSIFQQLGVLPGHAMLISVPLAQFMSPGEGAVGTADGETIPFEGRPDTTGGTTDLETAAVRWHFV